MPAPGQGDRYGSSSRRPGVRFLRASTVAFETPEHITKDTDKLKVVTKDTPLGVCVGIVPWNFPLFPAMAKIAPALLTGNTIIIKPS